MVVEEVSEMRWIFFTLRAAAASAAETSEYPAETKPPDAKSVQITARLNW